MHATHRESSPRSRKDDALNNDRRNQVSFLKDEIQLLLDPSLDDDLCSEQLRRFDSQFLQRVVDYLYESLHQRGYDAVTRSETLRRIWLRARLIPSTLEVMRINNISRHPFKVSARSDVYTGTLDDSSESKVALKCYRMGSDIWLKIHMFFLEAEIWRSLSNPTILPFLGIHSHNGLLYLVSPLMKGSTLPEYLAANPSANKTQLLREVVDGLSYLHSRPAPIIHGDLRGVNVLINERGQAVIADFGCSMITRPNISQPLPQCHITAGSPRWTAPEKMLPRLGSPIGLESDVYSLGCLVLEVLSKRLPFHHLRHDAAVVIEVLVKRRHPSCPDDVVASSHEILDRLWPLLERCWAHDSRQRPSLREIKEGL